MAGKDDILLEEQFAQKRMSAGTFLRLMSYVRPYRAVFIVNLIFTALATVSQLAGPSSSSWALTVTLRTLLTRRMPCAAFWR